MTESEIKSMLNDIINNDGDWQCRKPGHAIVSVNGVPTTINSPSNWVDYKLGDEIHSDWEYRKILYWYVYKDVNNKPYVITKNKLSKHTAVFKSVSERKCEDWVEEHTTTWLEEYLYQCTCYEGERTAAETAIEEVCKKILDEVERQVEVSYDTTEGFVIGKNQLRGIITDLGIKIC